MRTYLFFTHEALMIGQPVVVRAEDEEAALNTLRAVRPDIFTKVEEEDGNALTLAHSCEWDWTECQFIE